MKLTPMPKRWPWPTKDPSGEKVDLRGGDVACSPIGVEGDEAGPLNLVPCRQDWKPNQNPRNLETLVPHFEPLTT